jgi:hypothetical protein
MIYSRTRRCGNENYSRFSPRIGLLGFPFPSGNHRGDAKFPGKPGELDVYPWFFGIG